MVKIYIYKVQNIKLAISIIYLQIHEVWIKLFELIEVKISIKVVELNNINHKYKNIN